MSKVTCQMSKIDTTRNLCLTIAIAWALNIRHPPVSAGRHIPKDYLNEVLAIINHNYHVLVEANMGKDPHFTSITMKEKHLKNLKMDDVYCNIKTLRA